jgi:drug/metabolite transporter (DMT)-like permease
VSAQPPYVRISGHGLAMWITTPALLLLAAARPRSPFQYALWITAASVGIWTLFYQNTGWFQFGFRFSLDYIVFLLLLLAVDTRPLTRFAQVLIVAAIVINLFGAVTFNRYPQFYRVDRAAYEALVHE